MTDDLDFERPLRLGSFDPTPRRRPTARPETKATGRTGEARPARSANPAETSLADATMPAAGATEPGAAEEELAAMRAEMAELRQATAAAQATAAQATADAEAARAEAAEAMDATPEGQRRREARLAGLIARHFHG